MSEETQVKVICVLLTILLLGWGECSSKKSSNRFSNVQGSDPIQVTRCDIVCYYSEDKKEVGNAYPCHWMPTVSVELLGVLVYQLKPPKGNHVLVPITWALNGRDLSHRDTLHELVRNPDLFQCQRACMREPFKKHGFCPDSFANLPVFVQACMFFCSKDSDCPSTEKCCIHSCGQTCKPASGLSEEKHLPPIPVNLTAREKKRKNGVHLSWDMPPLDKNQLVLYVLEERHHLGRFYNEALLGEWNSIYSSRKTSINLKTFIETGYWYQFRVASVNINGTKGFSLESEGFKLTRRPKIQKPSKLRVEEIREKNGTIWGTVRWNPSEAPIPIQRYKIFWSHRLDMRDLKYKSETVLVQRDSVPETRLFYQLKNLKKDTDYFIQVQAIASYGRNSLKSKMAKMLFRTSKMEDQFEMADFD